MSCILCPRSERLSAGRAAHGRYHLSVDVAVDAIGLEPYDIAALMPIVHAAGGTLTDRTGTDNWRGDTAISSNGILHNDVIAILNS